jgi:hypothetical protein
MRVEYNINKVQDTSYSLAQYGLLDVHSPVAPGLTPREYVAKVMYVNVVCMAGIVRMLFL